MTLIFIVGVFVTGIAMTAVVLIGISQAEMPTLSREEELTAWEWALVKEERARRAGSDSPSEDDEP
jgi:hypothetical protein